MLFLKALRLARLVLRENAMAKPLDLGTETLVVFSAIKNSKFAKLFLRAGTVLSALHVTFYLIRTT